MSATVTRPNGRKITVTNLGWLRKHAADVKTIRLVKFTAADRKALPCTREAHHADGRMTAWLEDGTIYECFWASFELAQEWVKRPSLRHAKVELYYAGTLTEGI